VEFHIESKIFIALRKLVYKLELMDSNVLVKVMIQFEFGDIKMFEDWVNFQ
jgi:hypothetical protein